MVGKRLGLSSVGVLLFALVACTPQPSPPPPPVISGPLAVGSGLTVSPGAWQNSPTSYTYAWQRCTDAAAKTCVTVGSGSTYVLVAADAGSWIDAVVTGVNLAGPGGSIRATAVGPVVVSNPAAGCYPDTLEPGHVVDLLYSGTPAVANNLTEYNSADGSCTGAVRGQLILVLAAHPTTLPLGPPPEVSAQCLSLGVPDVGPGTLSQQGWSGLGDYAWDCTPRAGA